MERERHVEVHLVRHAQTDENDKGILQGVRLDTHLNASGRVQVDLLSEELRFEDYTHIYSSPLHRAIETVAPLRYGIAWVRSDKPPPPLIIDNRLRERDFGEMSGKHRDELSRELERLGVTVSEYTPPGGESGIDVKRRVENFLQYIYKRRKESDKLLFVCHGGILNTLTEILSGEESLNKNDPGYLHENASIKVFNMPLKNKISRKNKLS